MAEIERHEQYRWWLNELESLGVNTLEKRGLNHHKEASDLTEAVKQTLYEDYLQAENNDGEIDLIDNLTDIEVISKL